MLSHQDVKVATGEVSSRLQQALKVFQESSMAKQSFTKASRLLGSSQYSSVFNQARFRLSAANLLILARPSEIPARLGLVVGKKHVRSAVERNRIKRLIRESFRIRKQEFGTIDMVVMARSGLDTLSNRQITVQINLLFDELSKKLH